MSTISPIYDNKIHKKYSAKTIKNKIENKTHLQKEFGLDENTDVYMICIPTGVSDSVNGQALLELLPAMIALNLQIVILAKGEEQYARPLTLFMQNNSRQIAIVPDTEESIRSMYAAADAGLFLYDCNDTEELQQCLAYGVVPICMENTHVTNYNAIEENGNAFIFENKSIWHQFAAIVRARETYMFPYDYRTIQRHCMANEDITDDDIE